MLRLFINITFFCFICSAYAQGPYAPQAGLAGSTAIHKDSSVFVAWANKCTIQRGLLDIADPSLGQASVGNSSSALGRPGESGVVSLGDAGVAIVEFLHPVKDGIGPDFAIFENSFSPTFLELAFVEVSSDGINYFRFPAHSLTDTVNPIGGFGAVQPSNVNNLAGKYVANFGTPFDLSELPNNPLLDKQQITHIKIIDVVGTLHPGHARYDTANRPIQDVYPTPFPSGGFDLDAVGAIHIATTSLEELNPLNVSVYPNPVNEVLQVSMDPSIIQSSSYQLIDLYGAVVLSGSQPEDIYVNQLPSGIYYLRIMVGENQSTLKIVKR